MTLSLVILSGVLAFTGQYAYGLAVKMRSLGHQDTATRICAVSIIVNTASCAGIVLAVRFAATEL
jgi:hypothetical protein